MDVDNAEIWTELKESNPNLTFDKEDIYRLRSRTFVDGAATYRNSPSVKLNLRAAVVPTHVFMWRSRLEMTPYVPANRQCYNCGQLNHSTKFCKNSARCLTCSQGSHADGTSRSNILKCINCGGSHRSLSKECSEVIIKKKTTELMAMQNMDFNTAKRIVLGGSAITGIRVVESAGVSRGFRYNGSEFPALPNQSVRVGEIKKTIQNKIMSLVPDNLAKDDAVDSQKFKGNFVKMTFKGANDEDREQNMYNSLLPKICDRIEKLISSKFAKFERFAELLDRVIQSKVNSQVSETIPNTTPISGLSTMDSESSE